MICNKKDFERAIAETIKQKSTNFISYNHEMEFFYFRERALARRKRVGYKNTEPWQICDLGEGHEYLVAFWVVDEIQNESKV